MKEAMRKQIHRITLTLAYWMMKQAERVLFPIGSKCHDWVGLLACKIVRLGNEIERSKRKENRNERKSK